MGDVDTHPRYRAERLRQRLAEDAQQLGVDVAVTDAEVVLRGAVSSREERAGAAAMAAEAFPELRVRNELSIPALEEPGGGKALS